ncbi:hypothetical protein ACFRAE_08340 [Sphingobacterium sp. HJSM2_6]|uniref:hypothetical protein n=1 Tax=Sphingobacterium sp. HJSM2_6 TaxID=3366264 RepID=UPI003BCCA21D
MKNKRVALLSMVLGCLISSNSEAQILKNIGKKLEKKAEEVIDRSIDKVGSEKVERSNPSTEQAENSKNRQQGPFKNIAALPNDFVSGTEVIFFDDFSKDAVGKMGSHWTSNGTGSVKEVEGFDGKWLQMFHFNTYKIKDLFRIPENFTLEFDVLALAESNDKIQLNFGFDYNKGVGEHYFLANQNPVNVNASYRFNRFEFNSAEVEPKKKSEIEANMSYFINDIMKVKLMISGNRMHAYVNNYKILDTEMIDPMTRKYFYLALENENNEGNVYISNVKMTKLD